MGPDNSVMVGGKKTTGNMTIASIQAGFGDREVRKHLKKLRIFAIEADLPESLSDRLDRLERVEREHRTTNKSHGKDGR